MSIFSFFRRRIPDEQEVAKKEADKHKAEELASFEDDGDVPPEVVAKQVQKAEQAKPKIEVVEDDDFEDYEEEPEVNLASQKKKEGGFMNKLFGFGNKKQEQDEQEQAMLAQQQQQSIEDMKETIKILHKWLEKLPPDKIYEFKRSPDFEKYKEGLRKLGLIKE
ncbi:MAG: hypothetical protein ACP5N3_01385 [Candidatus Nanoarchaeia archaeon]